MTGTEREIIQHLKENPWLYTLKAITDKKYRSYEQVKYYWGVIVEIIGDFHWYNPIETNEILKIIFKKESFTDLSTKEFENVMDIIRKLWKEKYTVTIPKPNRR